MVISAGQQIASGASGNSNKQVFGTIIYNVMVYGAKVNGVTDDTVKVQAAIDAAFAAGGGTVFFPPGICIVSGIVCKSNVNLVGVENAATLKLKAASTNQLISGSNSANMDITGLILDGNKAQQTTLVVGLCNIKLTNCSQVRINKVVSKNAYFAHGVELIGGSNNIIEDSTFQSNQGNGIIFTLSTNLRIIKNQVLNNGIRGIADYGTTVSGSTHITIEGNTISGNAWDGISFEMDQATLQPRSSYVLINNNIVLSNLINGIICRCEHTTITNNKVLGNGTAIDTQGIILQAKYAVISNNEIKGNAGVGIDLGNCFDVIVSNNLVLENGCLGIEVNSSDQVVVSGNLVMGNNAIDYGVPTAGGIMVYGSTGYPLWTGVTSNVMVIGNRVLLGAFQKYGIYIDDVAENIVVMGNTLKASGTIGELYNQSALVIDRNNSSLANAPTNVSVSALTNVIIATLSDVFTMVGTTTINTIKFPYDVYPIGKEITIFFSAVTVVNDKSTLGTGNIHLTGSTSLTTTVGTVLRLMCNGTRWTEVSRSIK